MCKLWWDLQASASFSLLRTSCCIHLPMLGYPIWSVVSGQGRILACTHKPTSTHSPHGTSHQCHCFPQGHPGADVGQHSSTMPAPSSARTCTARQEVRSCCTAVGQSHYGPGLEVLPLGDLGNAADWLQCSACASASGRIRNACHNTAYCATCFGLIRNVLYARETTTYTVEIVV